MDFPTVLSRLFDLPGTFLRDDPVFISWENSMAFQLSEYCSTVDALAPMAVFSSANFGWLDVWGELFGIARNGNESNLSYFQRISETLQSPVGSASAIQVWSTMYWGSLVTVTENFSPGYQINLPSSINSAQLPQYVANLARIRPAGVPFTIGQSSEYTYLTTYKYLTGPRDAGAYLGGSNQEISVQILQPTINSQPILPAVLLSDPLLNSTV